METTCYRRSKFFWWAQKLTLCKISNICHCDFKIGNIPRNLLEDSPKCYLLSSTIVLNIPRNYCTGSILLFSKLLEHSLESFRKFSIIFPKISCNLLGILQNFLGHSPESIRTFSRVYSNIPRNRFEHSSEC